jgi:hypothetical protein
MIAVTDCIPEKALKFHQLTLTNENMNGGTSAHEAGTPGKSYVALVLRLRSIPGVPVNPDCRIMMMEENRT